MRTQMSAGQSIVRALCDSGVHTLIIAHHTCLFLPAPLEFFTRIFGCIKIAAKMTSLLRHFRVPALVSRQCYHHSKSVVWASSQCYWRGWGKRITWTKVWPHELKVGLGHIRRLSVTANGQANQLSNTNTISIGAPRQRACSLTIPEYSTHLSLTSFRHWEHKHQCECSFLPCWGRHEPRYLCVASPGCLLERV